MPKIVSDTTPVISLLKIHRLELLYQLYSKIFIPPAVFNEVEAGKTKKFYRDLSKIHWIEIYKIKDKQAGNSLKELDDGEAEAIIAAKELNADLILLDEKLGRFHAKRSGLNVSGTIGVLMKAKKAGLIKALKPLLLDLIDEDVWISNKLMTQILSKVGEEI